MQPRQELLIECHFCAQQGLPMNSQDKNTGRRATKVSLKFSALGYIEKQNRKIFLVCATGKNRLKV